MRNLRLPTTLACFAAVYGLAIAPGAKAVPDAEFVHGGSCQLSIPTTDTGVRPKATGFRNESKTTSNFVICTMPRSQAAGFYSFISLIAYSLDGIGRTLSCTAVVGFFGGSSGFDPFYSTQTATISDTSSTSQGLLWQASDFGGTAGDPILRSLQVSITCNLPPQTAINYITGVID